MPCNRPEELELFLNGQLSPEQEAEFAGHLASCPECCEKMAAMLDLPSQNSPDSQPCSPYFVSLQNVQPPAGLTEQVVRRLLQQKKWEFRQYCFQVVVSCCAAIALVFAGFSFDTPQNTQIAIHRGSDDRETAQQSLRLTSPEHSGTDFFKEVFRFGKEK